MSRKILIAALAAAWLPAARLAAESLTVETTLPAPSVAYGRVVTTGQGGKNTVLNRDGGNTILVPPANSGGKVGIGTGSPAKKLDVSGDAALTGTISGSNIKIAGNGIFTSFSCHGSITCRREGNTLHIELKEQRVQAEATPPADPPACVSDGSCSTVSCGGHYSIDGRTYIGAYVYGVDNCGNQCRRYVLPCQGSCTATCTARGVNSRALPPGCPPLERSCVASGYVGQRVYCDDNRDKVYDIWGGASYQVGGCSYASCTPECDITE